MKKKKIKKEKRRKHPKKMVEEEEEKNHKAVLDDATEWEGKKRRTFEIPQKRRLRLFKTIWKCFYFVLTWKRHDTQVRECVLIKITKTRIILRNEIQTQESFIENKANAWEWGEREREREKSSKFSWQ